MAEAQVIFTFCSHDFPSPLYSALSSVSKGQNQSKITCMLVRDPEDLKNTFQLYAIVCLKYLQCSLDWMKEPPAQSTFTAFLLHPSFLQNYLLTPAALLRYPAILSLCAVASSAPSGETSQANEFILNKGVINLLILSACFRATQKILLHDYVSVALHVDSSSLAFKRFELDAFYSLCPSPCRLHSSSH